MYKSSEKKIKWLICQLLVDYKYSKLKQNEYELGQRWPLIVSLERNLFHKHIHKPVTRTKIGFGLPPAPVYKKKKEIKAF
jgi:hypothetical protein